MANYDRTIELKSFDNTIVGVKGLVDAGVDKIPRIFIHPHDVLDEMPERSKTHYNFPIIDLDGINDLVGNKRKEIVDRVCEASENWGFFQVVNHGVPNGVMEEMLEGVRRFYEQETEAKKEWYTRDVNKAVVYNSNFDRSV